MFTGIITDVGRVRRLRRVAGGLDLTIATAFDPADIALGASIACSGVCLTVVALEPDGFATQASAETLACSTLGDWTQGTPVNLERALKVGDELGGHIVSGHVDGVGEIVSVESEGGSHRVRVRARVDDGRDTSHARAPGGTSGGNGGAMSRMCIIATVTALSDRNGRCPARHS